MNLKPEFVTFTGVDSSADLDAMTELSSRYPVEWGILFSPDLQGRHPRYPGVPTIERACASGLRLAAHLCGGFARSVMAGEEPGVPADLSRFARIQVNHARPDALSIAAFCASYGARGIAQSRGGSFPDDTEVDWLHDRSGGRGLPQDFWPSNAGRMCGYAGGIGPDNAAEVASAAAGRGPFWLDMESGVRDRDNLLDLGLCRRVCEALYG